MSKKDIQIKIQIDSDTKTVKVLNSEVKSLGKALNDTDGAVNTFISRLNKIAMATGGIIAVKELFQKSIGVGIEYNKTMEQLTNGLTTLNVITSSNITSLGRHINLQEKYALATNEAKIQVKELAKINKETPHTLSQTVEIYKAMYASMKKTGASTADIIDVTKKLSIASGSAGIQFQQLLAGVDGLATGTVLSNSELGRFLGTLGLTNEELRKSDNVVTLIQSKLKDVKVIQDFDTILSNLGNSFSIKAGEFTKPLFDDMKSGMLELTKVIDSLDVENIKKVSEEIAKIGTSALVAYGTVKTARTLYPIISTLARNFNLVNIQLSIGITKARLQTVAMRTLGTAMRMTPVGLLTMGISLLADKFIENREKANLLADSYADLSKKIKTLTIDALRLEQIENTKRIQAQAEKVGDLTVAYGKLRTARKMHGNSYFGAKEEEVLKAKLDLKEAQKKLADYNKLKDEIIELQNKPAETLTSNSSAKIEKNKQALADYYKFVGDKQQLWIAKQKEIKKQFKDLGADKLNKALTVAKEKIFGTGKASVKALKETSKSMEDFSNAYNQATMSTTQYQLLELKKRYDDFAKHNVDKVKLNEWYKIESEKITAQETQDKKNALKEYYKVTKNYDKLWLLEKKEVEKKYKKTLNPHQYKIMMANAKKEFFKPFKKENDELLKSWKNMTSSMSQSLEDNIFNFLDGKISSFKGLLKSVKKDLIKDFTNPVFRTMSKGLAGTLMGSLGLSTAGANSLSDTLKSAGLSLVNGEWIGGENGNSIKVSSTGEVIQGAKQLEGIIGKDGKSLLSNIKSLKSAYDLASNGLTSALMTPATQMAKLASMAETAGFSSVGNFFAGSTSVLSGGGTLTSAGLPAMAGGLLTAGALGAGAGYGIGKLGDKLFGADTKAGSYGAIGGATGAMIGSVVPVVGTVIGGLVGSALGSVIGGFRGKTKVTGKGLQTYANLYIDNIDKTFIKAFTDKKKKSWFSSKRWTSYKDLEDKDLAKIKGLFQTAEYLADSFTQKNVQVLLEKGKYSNNTLIDNALPKAILKSIINSFDNSADEVVKTQIIKAKGFAKFFNKPDKIIKTLKIDKVYEAWQSYAKDINKTTMEALSQTLQDVTKTRRTYNLAGKLGIEKVKANLSYAKKDLDTLANSFSINIKGLNVDNFLERYNKAISKNFTPENINKWNKLGDALQNVTKAQEEYTKALQQTRLNGLNATIKYKSFFGKDISDLSLKAKKEELLYFYKNNNLDKTEKDKFEKDKNEKIKKLRDEIESLGTVKFSLFHGRRKRYTKEEYKKRKEYINQIEKLESLGFKTNEKNFIDRYKKLFEKLEKENKLEEYASSSVEKAGFVNKMIEYLALEKKLNEQKEAIKLKQLQEQQQREQQQREEQKRQWEESQRELEKRRKEQFNLEKKRIETLNNSLRIAGSNLKQTFDIAKSTINSILGDNQTYTKNQYTHYLNEAKKYNKKVKLNPLDKENTKKFYESVNEASSFVNGYLDKSNFNRELDYKFAQLSAANTFNEFKNTASIYDKIDELVNEVREMKDNAKVQKDLTESIARFERRSANILEEMRNQNLSNNAIKIGA